MGILRPETVKLIAKEIYDYQISDESAIAIAAGTGALITVANHLGAALELGAIEPPFGYPNLLAAAARVQGGKL